MAVATWIDTPWKQSGAVLASRGIAGNMRYICSDYNTGPGSSMPTKRVERDEILDCAAHGVDSAVNFEDAADDYLGGYDRGKIKGQRAGAWMLNQLGWPAGGVCCSSIDADIGTQWGGLVQAYQFGFRDGLASEGPYYPGIYGPAPALNGALADGTARIFWLTAASYWSHGVVPIKLHMRQNGYWQWGSDADLDYTTTDEPMGTYLHPLGDDDMTPDDWTKMGQLIDARLVNYFANGEGRPSSGRIRQAIDQSLDAHKLATSAQVDSVEPVLATVTTKLAALDPATMKQTISDAIAAALAAGVPVDTITQALQQAVIPVSLSGHAGNVPTP